MHEPLWANPPPRHVIASWNKLKNALLLQNKNWRVWTNWFDRYFRESGTQKYPPLIENLTIARVLIAAEDWEKGPAHVNGLIAALEAEYWGEAPAPDEIEPQDRDAAQFRETYRKIDADEVAGRDFVATDPIAHDLHTGALAFAQALHDLVGSIPPGNNRPRPLAATVTRLIGASGATIAATRPGLLIPLAAALQVALDADTRRQHDPDLEGVPLSADEREALANASNAYKTWINTDPYLSALEGARLRTAAEPMDVDAVDAVVAAAVDQGAATPAAQALVNDAKNAGPESQFFNGTVLNFFRRGLKIAAVTAAGTGATVYGGAKVAAWLIANEAAILRLLASRPELLDVAIRLIAILKQMPLAGVL